VNGHPVKETYVPGDYFDYRSMSETTVPPHSYFVLGDHRSLSNDSRDFGAVEERYIYGKAVFVYWPVNKLGILH
jgi:signal peptidase I